MLRLRVLFTLVVVSTLVTLSSAGAQAPPDEAPMAGEPLLPRCGVDRLGNPIHCGGVAIGVEEGRAGSGPSRSGSGSGPSGPAVPTVSHYYEALGVNSGGGICLETGTVELPVGVPFVAPDVGSGEPLRRFGYCDALPPPGNEVAGTPPRVVAASYWQTVPLPAPVPSIAPGRAITGLAAFLETHGTLRYAYTNPNTLFGPLEIAATGAYYVDWGDGVRSGPYAYEGEPWPDGQIRHYYIDVGTYDVVVEIRWSATWSLGGQSGTLSQLRTEGRIDDFPVGQIQAVVVG